MRYRLLTLLATIAGLSLLLSPWPPLGVAGEWVWPRHPLPADLLEAIDRVASPLLCGVLVVSFATVGMQRIEKAGQMQRLLLLLGLACVSFLWLNAVRQAAPSPHRELRPLWILYDKNASGYYFEAAINVTSTSDMLAGYEARTARGDVLHEGTHPPGLLLLNRGLLAVCKSSPAIVELSERLQSQEAVRMFRELETAARLARPLSKPELAALHLSALLSTLVAAMTVIPVFEVTRRLRDSTTAWRAAVLMITVPTIGIFVPRSDVLYPCTGMLLTWAAVTALLTDCRVDRWVYSLLTGLVLFCCLLLSLAHLPVVVMLSIFACCHLLQDWKNWWRKIFEVAVPAIATVVCLCAMFQLVTHCNLLNVWRMNLTNHSAFYSQSVRTWSAWFLVSPIELAMSVGLPMACVAVVSIAQIWQPFCTTGFKSLKSNHLFVVACAVTWTLLWLSGKNMGEAARLWCFVTPWVAIAAAQQQSWNIDVNRRNWFALIIAQLVVATVTVGRVSGFLEF